MNESGSEEGTLYPSRDGGVGTGDWDMYKSDEPAVETPTESELDDGASLDEKQRERLAELSTLPPEAIPLWRAQGATGAGISLLVTVVLYAILNRVAPSWMWVIGVVLGLAVVVFLAYFLTIPIRYRQWRWSLSDERLYVEEGVVIHSTMLVPRNRIQNVTTDAGPLQRYYGLSTLKVHTAGMRTPNVEIPAVTREVAKLMRTELGHQE